MNDRLKSANDGEYNNLLKVALVIGLSYILIRGWAKSKQISYLGSAGTDKAVQQAQALRDAMNRSGFSWAMNLDFTDVDLIMQTANQITDFSAVADAYRVLYPGSELVTDLSNELSRTDLQKFYAILNSKSTGTGGTVATPVINPNVGKNVTAIQTTNIRADYPPYAVESNFIGNNTQAKAGELLGTYDSEKVIPNVPNAGNKNTFVRFKKSILFTNQYHWVVKSAVKIA